MPIYNLIEYSDLRTSEILWQYYGDGPALNNIGNIADFSGDNESATFNFKQKITRKTGNGGTKDDEVMAH